MKLVIDFSGFNINQRFIIREFSVCQIDVTPTIVRLFVTAIPPDIEAQCFRNSNYRQFRDKYGVKNHLDSAIDLDEFQEIVKDIIQDSSVFYLRNKEQLEQLISFCPIVLLYRDKVRLLEKIGFDDTNKVLSASCNHHISPRNYCTDRHAQLMAIWVINRKISKIYSRKNMQLIIKFSGFYDSNNSFRVKECNVVGINHQGGIVYKRLFVVRLVPHFINFDRATMVNYEDNYYNNFGIHYLDGNSDENQCLNKIRKLLKEYEVNIVYVSDHHQSYFLNYLIPDISVEVITLSDYNYAEELDVNHVNCVYHTHIVQSKNLCAVPRGWQMLYWIRDNEFYKSEVWNRRKNASDDINIDSRYYLHDDTVREFIIDGLNDLPVIDINDLET